MKTKIILLGLLILFGLVFISIGGESAIAQTDQPTTVPLDQIIIKYRADANLAEAALAQAETQMQRLSTAAGMKIEYFRPMSGEAHVLRLPERMPVDQVVAITDQLSALPEVEYAEPDYLMFPMNESINTPALTPNDPQYGSQWHYFAPTAGNYGVNAPAAWDINTGSASVYVAVLDTGITDHPDLSGRWMGGYDMISEPLIGNDGDGRDSDPHDEGDWITTAESSSGFFAGCRVTNSSWHGTHVAGTIGAATNNGVGVAGLNWGSYVIPVRVLGKCGGYTSDIADGITWAAGLSVPGVPTNPYPAQVINMSLGGSGSCEQVYQDAITAAYNAGSVIVVAAGNNYGADAGNYQPASCNNVITVAATDRDGDLANYSNKGSTVEISAPGGETGITSNGVLSTLNAGTTVPGSHIYQYYQGTSMAAPHVAGIASLLVSLDPSLTPAQVLAYMQGTITPFPTGSSCNLSDCGSGIINAGAALAAVSSTGPDAPTLSPISNPDGDGNYTVSWSAVSLAAQAKMSASPDAQSTSGPKPFENISQGLMVSNPEASTVLNVPAYLWYRGCGPTAAGMVLGYWDSNGFGDLVGGNATTQTAAVDAMISSTANYNDYCLPLDSPPDPIAPDLSELPEGDEHADNSIADFMETSQSIRSNYYGWAWFSAMDDAFRDYVQLVAPAYSTIVENKTWSEFSWNAFKTEIDAGRPVVFLVDTNADGSTDHFVPAIGYNDDGGTNMYACLNTWDESVHWYEFAEVASGQSWGIYGATTFQISGSTANTKIYLPLVLKNAGGTTYTLQEDDNAGFTSPTPVYTGPDTSWNATGKAAGTYFYRVMASNSQGDSIWSNIESVTVYPTGCVPDPPGDSNNINDALIVCSGQTVPGQVDYLTDWDDVFRIYALNGQVLTISMNGTGGDADLYLYPPGTTDLYADPYIASSINIGNDEYIQGTVLTDGYWYINVYAFSGTTNYNVTATLSTSTTTEIIEFQIPNTDKSLDR